MNRIAFLLALALLSARGATAAQAVYLISTGADSGPGSLREAITEFNSIGACFPGNPIQIRFPARTSADTPPLQIQLTSPLPPIKGRGCGLEFGLFRNNGPDVEIHGSGIRFEDAANMRMWNVSIVGAPGDGLVVSRSSIIRLENVSVTDSAGMGIIVAFSDRIVATADVSGSGANGIYVTTSVDVTLRGSAIANGANGVVLDNVHGSTMFAAIRDNATTGLLVTGDSIANDFSGSTFTNNGLLGIDIGADGPTPAGAPEIDGAQFSRGTTRVGGTIHSKPRTAVHITVYANDAPDPTGFGEGAHVLSGTVVMITTDSEGNGRWSAYFVESDGQRVRNRYVTATATVSDGTSEFSRAVLVHDEEPNFVVTTTADDGVGSLRQEIRDVNASPLCNVLFPCWIMFNITDGPDQHGVRTIAPRTALPTITATGVVIDGSTQRAFTGDTNAAGPEIEIAGRNCGGICNGIEYQSSDSTVQNSAPHLTLKQLIVNGFSGDGVRVTGVAATDGRVSAELSACFIGTDSAAANAAGNGRGIHVENVQMLIGNSVISGNHGDGISIVGGSSFVDNNRIGTDAGGFVPLSNAGSGIRTTGPTSIMENLIAFNGDRGIATAQSNSIVFNIIHSNGSLGIDVGIDGPTSNGTPGIVDAPVLDHARSDGNETRITFTLPRESLGSFGSYVDFFNASFLDATGRGEGRTRLFSRFVSQDDAGREIDAVVPQNVAGKFVTATATKWLGEEYGPTSEFSNGVQVTSGDCPNAIPNIEAASTEDGVTTVRWTGLTGATEYRIWFMARGDEPRIAFRGVATSTAVRLPGGSEWWIEARFDPCYGTQSEHRFVP